MAGFYSLVVFLFVFIGFHSTVHQPVHGSPKKLSTKQTTSTTQPLPLPPKPSVEVRRWLKTTHFALRQCKPLQPPPFNPQDTGTFQKSEKNFMEVPMCQPPTPLPYDHYHFPNAFGQSKIQQVLEALYLWWPIVSSQCSPYLPSLLCSMYMPACFPLMPNKGEQPNILPCRETCESVRRSCDDIVVRQANLTWPPWLDCSLFPRKRLTPSDRSVAETIKYKDRVCIDFTDEQHIEHELLVNVDKVREDARRRALCRCHCFADQITNATADGEPYFPKKAKPSSDEKQKWRDRLLDCKWGCNVWHYTFGVCYHELDAESVNVVIKLTRHSVTGWLLLTGFCVSLLLTIAACSFGCCWPRNSRSRRVGINRRTSLGSVVLADTPKVYRRMSRFYWPLFAFVYRWMTSVRQRTLIGRNPYRHIVSSDNVIHINGDEIVK